ALLLGDLGDQGEPVAGVLLGVGEGDAQRAVVDVPLVEMFEEGALVRGAKLGQVNLVVHDDVHASPFASVFSPSQGPLVILAAQLRDAGAIRAADDDALGNAVRILIQLALAGWKLEEVSVSFLHVRRKLGGIRVEQYRHRLEANLTSKLRDLIGTGISL